jgi:hypothetical protein
MSQQCDQKAILDAMGLTWADILGERAMTPAIRQRIADIGRLEKLEHRFGWIIMGKAVNPDRRLYWLSAEAGIERDIWLLRQRLAVK